MADQEQQGPGGRAPSRIESVSQDILDRIEPGVEPEGFSAMEAIDAVMCVFMARLSEGEAEDVVLGLPEPLRPLLRPCALHGERPEPMRREGFLQRVAEHLGTQDTAIAADVAQVVFAAIKMELKPKEIDDVASQLPGDLVDLWNTSVATNEDRAAGLGLSRPDKESEDLLRQIVSAGPLPNGIRPADAAAAVMCVLMQRLSGGEARDVWAEVPSVLRSELGPCALHDEQPEVFGREVFLSRVGEHLHVDERVAEDISRRVFSAVKAQLSAKEAHDVESRIPEELGDLWHSAA